MHCGLSSHAKARFLLDQPTRDVDGVFSNLESMAPGSRTCGGGNGRSSPSLAGFALEPRFCGTAGLRALLLVNVFYYKVKQYVPSA